MMKKLFLNAILAGLCFGGTMQADDSRVSCINQAIDKFSCTAVATDRNLAISKLELKIDGLNQEIQEMAKRLEDSGQVAGIDHLEAAVAVAIGSDKFRKCVLEGVRAAIGSEPLYAGYAGKFRDLFEDVCKIAENNLDENLCADNAAKELIVSMLELAEIISENRLVVKRLELEIEEIKRGKGIVHEDL